MQQITKIAKNLRLGQLRWILCSCVAVVALLLAGCNINRATPLPTSGVFASPISPIPTSVPLPAEPLSGSNEGLPPGTQLVGAQYRGDFDGDGQPELATGYKNLDGGGGAIVSDILESGYKPVWQEEIAQELTPNDFQLRDLDGDVVPELLLFAENSSGQKQYVFVYAWRESTYIALIPMAGPLEGQNSFLSLYWPPMLDDVDFNGATEIITFVENTSNPEALSAAVYEWNGSEFRYTPLYIIPPRFKPE